MLGRGNNALGSKNDPEKCDRLTPFIPWKYRQSHVSSCFYELVAETRIDIRLFYWPPRTPWISAYTAGRWYTRPAMKTCHSRLIRVEGVGAG